MNTLVKPSHQKPPMPSWRDTLKTLWDWRVLCLLAMGFSAGIPILLIFSSLSLWLGEAGVERKALTFFSWAALGYSFKFVWAPLVDRLPLPLLGAWLGRRRSWMLLAQCGVVLAILGMASTDPAAGEDALTRMAMFAVLLGFASATQDIVIDAYRIEIAGPEQQGLLSSAYIAGYRLGMIVAGAGALYLASYWGSSKGAYVFGAWQWTYGVMAAIMVVGMLTTLITREPAASAQAPRQPSGQHLRLLGVFLASVVAFVGVFAQWGNAMGDVKTGPLLGLLLEAVRMAVSLAAAFGVGTVLVKRGLASREQARTTWVMPVLDFFARYGARNAWLLLALIGLYRISDIVLGVISNVFYQDLGFSKIEIANAVKTFGVVVSIVGGFWGGLLAARIGVMRSLFWGAVLSALTNLGFVWLAYAGHHVSGMYVVVAADNLAAGFASAAFVAFLSSLTNVSFTAVQYAIFSSLMTLLPKTLGGYSGGMVDAMGYPGFFMLTTLMGLPVLLLVALASRLQAKTLPNMT
ncbi:MFS transporter [Limnohabitans planktonicus II-D5]|uniref:MFS transporter n=2 Tax=Limnohabitans planktonicus TaxID=540060 RepID=A0A2T7U9V5_9BURK|nr:MFS transporter [Limnohabitans planktonicus II-D5]